jgi:hypothetical protein
MGNLNLYDPPSAGPLAAIAVLVMFLLVIRSLRPASYNVWRTAGLFLAFGLTIWITYDIVRVRSGWDRAIAIDDLGPRSSALTLVAESILAVAGVYVLFNALRKGEETIARAAVLGLALVGTLFFETLGYLTLQDHPFLAESFGWILVALATVTFIAMSLDDALARRVVR